MNKIFWTFFTFMILGCTGSNHTKLPVHEKSINIRSYSLSNGKVNGINCKVKSPYPSTEILSFYEKKLSEIGFESFVESYYRDNDRKWRTHKDGTFTGEPIVAQLVASWSDSNR